MIWNFQSDRPIYTQLMEQIRFSIVSGIYPSGSKLPSVRDLATEAAVNPNTMQKAMAELERSGLIYSQRTSGRFVTEDNHMIMKVKKELAREQIEDFFKLMDKLGFPIKETVSLVEETAKELKV